MQQIPPFFPFFSGEACPCISLTDFRRLMRIISGLSLFQNSRGSMFPYPHMINSQLFLYFCYEHSYFQTVFKLKFNHFKMHQNYLILMIFFRGTCRRTTLKTHDLTLNAHYRQLFFHGWICPCEHLTNIYIYI